MLTPLDRPWLELNATFALAFRGVLPNSTFTNSSFENLTSHGTSPVTHQLNENSWASVFSTFLALAFCIITQPYGSVIFPRQGGWSWRLSPGSALLAALLIFAGLLFCRSSNDRILLPVSTSDPDDNNSEFGEPYCGITITGQRHVPMVLNEQQIQSQPGMTTAAYQELYVPSENKTSMIIEPTLCTNAAWLPARAPLLASTLSETRNIRTTATTAASTLMNSVCILRKVWRSIISFKLSHLKHGWLPSAALLLLFRSGNYTADIELERQIIVDELGTYIGKHTKGRRIQYWTTISVFFLLVKLCAIRGAPIFTFIGMIYVISWLSVEVLLISLQHNGLSEGQVEALLESRRAVAKLERLRLWGARIWVFTSYCTILWMLIFFILKTTTGFNIFVWLSSVATAIGPLLAVAGSPSVRKEKCNMCFLLCYVILSISSITWWPYYILFAVCEGLKSGDSGQNIWGAYSLATLIFWLIRFLTLVCLAGLLFGACIIASSTKQDNLKVSMIWQRIVNALFCLLTIGAYLLSYTPNGTYKPPFLEIIGM